MQPMVYCPAVEEKEICIFCDSKSTLRAIKETEPGNCSFQIEELRAQVLSSILYSCGLQPIAHCGKIGNERVDEAAKLAATTGPVQPHQWSLKNCKRIAAGIVRRERIERKHKLYKIQPTSVDLAVYRTITTLVLRAKTSHIDIGNIFIAST